MLTIPIPKPKIRPSSKLEPRRTSPVKPQAIVRYIESRCGCTNGTSCRYSIVKAIAMAKAKNSARGCTKVTTRAGTHRLGKHSLTLLLIETALDNEQTCYSLLKYLRELEQRYRELYFETKKY